MTSEFAIPCRMFLLQPSKHHGVGVFTTGPFPRGARLALFRADDWRFVRAPRGEQRRWCQRFGVAEGDGYHCPRHWNRMSIGWYLNHSPQPNVRMRGLSALAVRAIRSGEELTVNYGAL